MKFSKYLNKRSEAYFVFKGIKKGENGISHLV